MLPRPSEQLEKLTAQGALGVQPNAGVPPVAVPPAPLPPLGVSVHLPHDPSMQVHVPLSPVQVEPGVAQSPPTRQSAAVAPPPPLEP